MSPALYLQQVEGVRTDLALLDQEHFRRTWNLPAIRRRHPELLDGLEAEADALQRLLVRFEGGEPYDPAEIQRAFETVIGGILENGRRRGGAWVGPEIEPGFAPDRLRIPDGLLLRLVDPAEEPALPPPVEWPDLPPDGEPGGYLSAARLYSARMAALNGNLAARFGDEARARRDWERALAWDPANPVARAGLRAEAAEPNPVPGVSSP
jgi:hypothetical protein